MDWTEQSIETQRLVLRPLVREDGDFVHQLYSDCEVAKRLNRVPFPFTQS